jgi:dCTP deaminase
MSFWSSEKLLAEQAHEPLVEPFRPQRVKQGAYELTLGPEYFITADEHGQKQHRKLTLADHDHMVIPPGQFALLLTEEIVTIPKGAIGFISIKASLKFQGLVNVSGFHVDPGFSGRLKFAVYNAGSQEITLAKGQELFPLWFSDLDRPTVDFYRGVHQGQNEITAKDVMDIAGVISSPAQLKREIDQLRTWLQWFSVGVGAVVTCVLLPLLVWIFEQKSDGGRNAGISNHPENSPPVVSSVAYPASPTVSPKASPSVSPSPVTGAP